MTQFASIETAINTLRDGHMIILVDDEQREHEGDLVMAAEKITAEAINFMSTHARGLICLALTKSAVDRLELPLMPTRNRLPHQAAFTISIEVDAGVATGISAQGRAHTIKIASDKNASAKDISMPGHVFPLQAKEGGVLVRPGHTEGSIDLVKLTGLEPAAVLCEVMNADGTMARVPDLQLFSRQHNIPIVSINDLIAYLNAE